MYSQEGRGLALKLILWNVQGLNTSQHILLSDFADADLLLLTETWTLLREDATALPGYTCFSSSRAYMHAQAVRPSGGVACYVRNSLAMHFELWKAPPSGPFIWLRSKHRLVQCSGDHHLFIGLVYQPPRSSTFQQHSDSVPILEQFQHDVAEIAAYDELVMLARDFNARTHKATDTLSPDIAADLLDNAL